jgi:hypothetical protein
MNGRRYKGVRPRIGMAGAAWPSCNFQAVASGTTWVLITDVVVKGHGGGVDSVAVSASNLQVTVDSAPPPDPRPGANAAPPPWNRPPRLPKTATKAERIHRRPLVHLRFHKVARFRR